MEKVESLEQAAREFFDLHWDAIRPDAKISRDAFDFAAAFAKKKTAERERQVWAEAAKIAEGFDGNCNYDVACLVNQRIATALRARGEQVK